MGALCQDWKPTLKFLGVQNGVSDSHTNAFFMPDEETFVLVDLSLLNARKAERLILSKPGLKNFYACVTHNHYDHASGFGLFAFAVKVHFPGCILKVIVDERIAAETTAHFDSEGLRSLHDDKLYELYMIRHTPKLEPDRRPYGHGELGKPEQIESVFCRYNSQRDYGIPVPSERPEWLLDTIPTEHSQRLSGASGFVFHVCGHLIVYSGDTNTLEPYMKFFDEKMLGRRSYLSEFYLESAMRQSSRHLYFPEISAELERLLERYSGLKVILMHYDDRAKLRKAVLEQIVCCSQITLAEPAVIGLQFTPDK